MTASATQNQTELAQTRRVAPARHRKKIGLSKRIVKEVLYGILGNVARRVHLGVIEDSTVRFTDFVEV